MKLRFNPFGVFKSSKTPIGLYARQKWLGEFNNRKWKSDFQETVLNLLKDQAGDGSWYQSEFETIKRLFGLHLTVREETESIRAALGWLSKKLGLPLSGNQFGSKADIHQKTRAGLPFMASRRDTLFLSATLFLSSIFDRHNDSHILESYRWLSSMNITNKGLWMDRASSHNIFRAMVVHPIYSRHATTLRFVQYLAKRQTNSGDWGNGFPFHQTLNALAHLDDALAGRQVEKAFVKLIKTQNKDGTWKDNAPEWDTFLAVHALKNKGIL